MKRIAAVASMSEARAVAAQVCARVPLPGPLLPASSQ